MSPELEARIYQDVLRAVLWGENRDRIFHMLQVNGITGHTAEEMFARARSERVSEIRSAGMRKGLKGAAALVTGGALFCLFWFGFGAITRGIYIVCGLLVVFGVWWSFDGILTAALAGTKKGSIASDE